MRLTAEEVLVIKRAAVDAFGAEAVIRLFGSRVDDTRKGGDIDLHIELPDRRIGAAAEIPFRRTLWRQLDMLDIDVVIAERGAVPRWIDKAAYRQGVIL